MVSPVKDPELLALLEGEAQQQTPSMAQPVRDPELLAILNQPAEQAPLVEQEQAGFMDELGRQLGLTGRAIAGGAAQAVEPFTEPLRYMMNKALHGNPIGNIEAATDTALTQMGVPEPQGAVERGVQSVGRFATGAGLGMGGAKVADDIATGIIGGGRQVMAEAPTTEQLRELANAAYKAADDAGVVVHPGSFKNFASNVSSAVRQAGIDKDIHPKATAAIRRIQEAADSKAPIKLEDIEILRRVVQGARNSIDADERRIGSIITNQLDDYVSRMGANDVIAGDPKAASAALSTARNLWMRMSRSNVIQDAVEKAGVRAGQFTGSGFENALRTQFRQIAMNPKRMRGFSPEEQEAIKKVAMGGPLDNAFRMLGKLAPTGVVSGGVSGAAGYAIGGPVGAVMLPAVGMGARRGATELTKKNVENVSDMVRRGAPRPEDAPEWLLPWLSGGIFGVDTQGN